jgi:cell shape-determining protein MreD
MSTEQYKIPGALMNVATQVESQALNAVVAGFSFAAAVAWMDVVRFLISVLVQVNKNNPNYYVLSALFTTVLAVVVYVVVKNVARNVAIAKPSQVYAVGRA